MFFVLSKLLSFFFHPFSWALLLLVIAWITKRPFLSRRSFRAGMIILLVFTNQVIFLEFARLWEEKGTKIEEVGHYDCAIVLTGMAEWDNNHKRLSIRRGADRLWQTLNLYHLGKVDRILISGSNGHLVDRGLEESRQFKEVLVENGIPDSVILIDTVSKNTYENAVESKKVIDRYPEIESILLVTSALHMKRSKACFSAAGFEDFDCFTTDHYTGEKRGYSFEQYLVPDFSVMSDWYRLIHEWFGYVSYSAVGYL